MTAIPLPGHARTPELARRRRVAAIAACVAVVLVLNLLGMVWQPGPWHVGHIVWGESAMTTTTTIPET